MSKASRSAHRPARHKPLTPKNDVILTLNGVKGKDLLFVIPARKMGAPSFRAVCERVGRQCTPTIVVILSGA
jgi:hypothetical protein